MKDGRAKLLEFGMGTCKQCKRMRRVMDRARRELKDRVDVHFLDIRNEANEELADRYEMRLLPLVVLVDGAGRQLWRHDGFVGFGDVRAAVLKHTKARSRK